TGPSRFNLRQLRRRLGPTVEPEFRMIVGGYGSWGNIDQRAGDTFSTPRHRRRLYKDRLAVNPDEHGSRMDKEGQEQRNITPCGAELWNFKHDLLPRMALFYAAFASLGASAGLGPLADAHADGTPTAPPWARRLEPYDSRLRRPARARSSPPSDGTIPRSPPLPE